MHLSIRMLSYAIAVWTMLITPVTAQDTAGLEEEMAKMRQVLSHKNAEMAKLEIAVERASRGEDGGKYNQLIEQKLQVQEELIDLRAKLEDLGNAWSLANIKQANQAHSTQVFMLKNLDGWEFIDTIQKVYRVGSVSYVQRTNSVVVREKPETLAQVAELLEQLEQQAAAGPGDEVDAQVFLLKNRKATSLAEMLRGLFERKATIEAEEYSPHLIVRAAPPEMEKIERLIAELDADEQEGDDEVPRTLSINVDLIQATTASRERGNLPDNLRDVGEALLANGVGNPHLFGHLMVRAAEGENFHSNGLVDSHGTNEPTFVKISGQVHVAGDNKQAQLEFKASIQSPIVLVRGDAEKARARASYEDFGIETNSALPLGDYIVLGAIPARLEHADTVLIVIRVTTE